MADDSDSSDDDLLIAAMVYRQTRRKRLENARMLHKRDERRQHRRVIAPLFLNHDCEGAMEIMVNRHLKNNERRFIEYFRLSSESFAFVLRHVQCDIISVATNSNPEPIPPEVKLAVALR